MSYRHNLHPRISKAEFQVFEELSKRNLTTGMVTQQPIVLKSTIPDFSWIEKRKAVYLDGDAVHKVGDEWDQEVVTLLEKRQWQVLRISYHAPLTQQRLGEIIKEIEEFVN
jgi:very-short-patch-repair endonuclease